MSLFTRHSPVNWFGYIDVDDFCQPGTGTNVFKQAFLQVAVGDTCYETSLFKNPVHSISFEDGRNAFKVGIQHKPLHEEIRRVIDVTRVTVVQIFHTGNF